jgi:hypothetical protein
MINFTKNNNDIPNLNNIKVDINDVNASETNSSNVNASEINASEINASEINASDTCFNDLCLNLECLNDLIIHIREKKRKMDLFRKILELKYHRYKSCHNFWSVSTILLSSVLTLIESCKLIFVDDNGDNETAEEFFAFSPIFISTVITCSTSILKFKKYQEKMELLNNVIQNCVMMNSKLKNKKELLQLHKSCNNKKFLEEFLNTYNEEILIEYCNIYQESQKYIKSTDYDKYAKQINYSELYKHMIEQERQEFYAHYKKHYPKIILEDVMKKSNEKKNINTNCCGF